MRLVSSIAVIAALALAACGQATTASTQAAATASEEAAATNAAEGGSMSMSMTAQAGGANEAAQCMAYTTLERQAVLSGHARGDAASLLRATAAWRNSVADQPEAMQFYEAAMGAYNSMSAADLKAAADDCVARAPAG